MSSKWLRSTSEKGDPLTIEPDYSFHRPRPANDVGNWGNILFQWCRMYLCTYGVSNGRHWRCRVHCYRADVFPRSNAHFSRVSLSFVDSHQYRECWTDRVFCMSPRLLCW